MPGYAISNWGVLQLPKVLTINLGRNAKFVGAACVLPPFIRTGMTEEYVDNARGVRALAAADAGDARGRKGFHAATESPASGARSG